MTPGPVIPFDQLRAQIASFRHMEANKAKSWIYYVGGGLDSGFILLIVICCVVCWRCKHHQSKETRSPPHIAYTASENPNMKHQREGAIRAGQHSALGQGTVGFQDPVGNRRLVMDYEMPNAFASAPLDQLEDLCVNVKEYDRRLRPRQYSAVTQIEN